MMTLNRTYHIVRRSLALSALLGAGLIAAQAQQATAPASVALPTLNLQLPADGGMALSSSSSADDQVADNHFDLLATPDAQPPGRSYGRPRYRGGNTNADGSNKYAFMAGAGYTQPLGDTYHYLTPSWGMQVGGGRNYNKNFGVLLQFDYDNFGFNGRTLANQEYIYNYIFGVGAIPTLDGNSHVWSFTLNPTYTIYSGEGFGAYVVAGVGFYHKTANFTTPEIGEEEDEFGNIYQFQANETVDDYTSNAPGFNGGFGVTYKLSRFSNEHLYGEVRYVFVDNSQRSGFTAATVSGATQASTNFYPANSNRTTYMPVKFGIRF